MARGTEEIQYVKSWVLELDYIFYLYYSLYGTHMSWWKNNWNIAGLGKRDSLTHRE